MEKSESLLIKIITEGNFIKDYIVGHKSIRKHIFNQDSGELIKNQEIIKNTLIKKTADYDEKKFKVEKIHSRLKKREIFIRIIFEFVKLYCEKIFFHKIYKKKLQADKSKLYLIYQASKKTIIILNLNHKFCTKNIPRIFSKNKYINIVHYYTVRFIYKQAQVEQEFIENMKNCGIGTILETTSQYSKLQNDSLCKILSLDLIIATEEKNLFFYHSNLKSKHFVASFFHDTELKNNGNGKFENILYSEHNIERLLQISEYYTGAPLNFTANNFKRVIDEIDYIQSKEFGEKKISFSDLENYMECIRQIHNLSFCEISRIEKNIRHLFDNKPELARLSCFHGDCVPSNIFLESNGRVIFIDETKSMEHRYFFTDIITLIAAFMAGEPYQSNPKRILSVASYIKYLIMQKIIRLKYNITKHEFESLLFVGLAEKVLICKIEARDDVTEYWIAVTRKLIILQLKKLYK